MKTLVIIITLLSNLSLAQSGELSASDIMSKILDNQRGATAGRSIITMTVIKPNKETVFKIESISNGDEDSLIKVLEPAKDAGQAFLTAGDNLWIYNPRLKRTLRLPPSGRSDSFLGSDISYNDLGGRDQENDYIAKIIEQTADYIVLELTPKESAPTPYGKIVITASKETLAPSEYLYYDQREQAVRKISFSNYAQIDDFFYPTHMEIQDLLKEGRKTIIDISDYEFGIEIPANCFSKQALERGCNY